MICGPPNGQPVPALTDFLLTWEEVIEPLAMTKVHEVFRRVDSDYRNEALVSALGHIAVPSHFDGIQKQGAYQRSLRFAPVYFYKDDPFRDQPLFENETEKLAWQEEAQLAAERKVIPPCNLVQLLGPQPFRSALWGAIRAKIISK